MPAGIDPYLPPEPTPPLLEAHRLTAATVLPSAAGAQKTERAPLFSSMSMLYRTPPPQEQQSSK